MMVVINFLYLLIKEFKVKISGISNIQSKNWKWCWALVIGGTNAIGKGFSLVIYYINFKELAKQGVNVCMVARNRLKAENLI